MKGKNAALLFATVGVVMLMALMSIQLCFADSGDAEGTLPDFSDIIIDFPETDEYNYGPLDGEIDEALTGDVNGDGTVNVMDATLIQKHIVKICPIDSDKLLRADVNGDKYITSEDIILLQKKIIHLV